MAGSSYIHAHSYARAFFANPDPRALSEDPDGACLFIFIFYKIFQVAYFLKYDPGQALKRKTSTL